MEKELAQAQRMEAIGQLAAGIAHEINTPTQYIGDNARFLQDAFADVGGLLDSFEQLLQAARSDSVSDELLQEIEAKLRAADLGYLAREIPQAIEQSLEGVDHVANIVGAMKEFSHPGNGRQAGGRSEPRHLRRRLRFATASGNTWPTWSPISTPNCPPVHCVPTDINSVMMNLWSTPPMRLPRPPATASTVKGVITIRTRYDDPYAEIRVEDTGAGIPEDVRAQVFDLFFTTKEVGQGTGRGWRWPRRSWSKAWRHDRFREPTRLRHHVHRPVANQGAPQPSAAVVAGAVGVATAGAAARSPA